MSRNLKVNFPHLDGLRFCAFFLVFLSHCNVIIGTPRNLVAKVWGRFTNHGDLGVTFFFVLSGFLISYLLFAEKSATARIRIPQFYVRRVLRIWPVYFLVILIAYLLSSLSYPELSFQTVRLPYYLLFLSNLDMAWHGVSNLTLSVLWSVAVEEQFYFLFPVCVALLPVRFFPAFALSIVILCIGYRWTIAGNIDLLQFHSLSVCGSLAVGCLIGYYSFYSERFKAAVAGMPRLLIVAVYGFLIALMALRQEIFRTPALRTLETTVFAVTFAAIILEQNFAGRSLFKMGNNLAFTVLGKYSYGLYAYHIAVVFLTAKWATFLPGSALKYAFALTVSLLIALLSFYLLEKPFLSLKKRFAVLSR